MRRLISRSIVLLATLIAVGCGAENGDPKHETGDSDVPKKHSHAGDDQLFWQRRDIEHAGYSISLGHHGIHLHAGEPAEPAVMIMKNGEPVADAQVFVSLLAEDKKTVLSEEVACVYEPPTSSEPSHYAQGKVNMPADSADVVLYFRIVFAGEAAEFKRHVPVKVETHD